MKEKVLVILGSSREDGHTLKAVKSLIPFSKYDVLDLNKKKLCYYSYKSKNTNHDDFHSIGVSLLDYEFLVFATPVYWYSMSGQMKVFFDRLTELTGQYKPIGKALRGKKVYLIVSGGAPQLPDGFEIPFKLTAEYFDMEFKGTFYQQGV